MKRTLKKLQHIDVNEKDKETLSENSNKATIISYNIARNALLVAVISMLLAGGSLLVAVLGILNRLESIDNNTAEQAAIHFRSSIPPIIMRVYESGELADEVGSLNEQEINATPGSVVNASFIVRNNANVPLDLNVRINPPMINAGVSIIEDSIRIYSRQFPNGRDAGNVLGRQFSLGNFNPYEMESGEIGWVEVKFQIKIDEDVASLGLVNRPLQFGSQVTGYDEYGLIATDTHRAFVYVIIIEG